MYFVYFMYFSLRINFLCLSLCVHSNFSMSDQPSLAEFRAEAEALGLEGEEALNFLYKQQEFYIGSKGLLNAVLELRKLSVSL